jgi:hypothetical protein
LIDRLPVAEFHFLARLAPFFTKAFTFQANGPARFFGFQRFQLLFGLLDDELHTLAKWQTIQLSRNPLQISKYKNQYYAQKSLVLAMKR